MITVSDQLFQTSDGTLNVSGGSFMTDLSTVRGDVDVQTGSFKSVDVELSGSGRVTLQGGSFSAENASFADNGQFNFTGGTLHVEFFEGDLVNEGGALAPGQSAGSTAVVGNYTQEEDAALEIEIGGPLIGTEYDFVNVIDTAFLGGNLSLTLIDDFVPDAADTFTVFNAANVLGFFDNVTHGQRLMTVDGLGSFLVNYGPTSSNPNQIVLTDFELTPLLFGDYNENGVVDAADYTMWRDNLGSKTSLPNDNTPEVNVDDYGIWKSNYGQTVAMGSSAKNNTTVPEPTISTLLMLTVAGWCLRQGLIA